MGKLKGKLLSKKTISIVLVAVLVVGCTGYIAFDKYKQNKAETEFVAREREYVATKGNIRAGVKGAGNLRFDVVKHNFEESVVIGEVFVKEGQTIKVGDKLVSISEKYLDEKLEELNKVLDEAKLALEQAQGNKSTTLLTNEKSWSDKVQGSENQYTVQRKELDESINDLNYKISILNNKVEELKVQIAELSKNESENITLIEELKANQDALISEKTTFEENLESAKKNLKSLEESRQNELNLEASDKSKTNEINNISLKSLNNAIDSAREVVNNAQEKVNEVNNLKESPILYAKVDGIVSGINNTDGSPTNTEGSIVDIGESSKVTAEVVVSQNDIINIEEGQKVILEVAGYEAETFNGKVKSINLKPNSQGNSTSYSATIELDETDRKLLDGMTVTAQFIINEVNDVITLSNKAIELRNGKQIVRLKNKDGSITDLEIKTGFSDGKLTEIISGLNDGDTVVVGG